MLSNFEYSSSLSSTTLKAHHFQSQMAASRRKMRAHQARQRSVSTVFKTFVSESTQRLLGYSRHFERIEAFIQDALPTFRAHLEAEALAHEGPDFLAAFENELHALVKEVRDFDQPEHAAHAFYFRQQMWPFISAVPIMERCCLRPRGYPGDSTMMQMFYDADYQGAGLMAKLLHWHAVHVPAAQAVRNRRRLIADRLHASAQSRQGRIRVLSLACGPAAELHDILERQGAADQFEFVFLDQDLSALQEAKEQVSTAEKNGAGTIRASFEQMSVLDLLGDATRARNLGHFDFIYSMGLYDYLETHVAQPLTALLFERLGPHGILILGNYHVSNPHEIYMRYWSDWNLLYRTEDAMRALVPPAVSASDIELGFEPSGTQMFLQLRRT